MVRSSNDITHQNMKALHNTRQNYIAAESSERRALKHKVHTYSDVLYDDDDEKVDNCRKNFKVGKVLLLC